MNKMSPLVKASWLGALLGPAIMIGTISHYILTHQDRIAKLEASPSVTEYRDMQQTRQGLEWLKDILAEDLTYSNKDIEDFSLGMRNTIGNNRPETISYVEKLISEVDSDIMDFRKNNPIESRYVPERIVEYTPAQKTSAFLGASMGIFGILGVLLKKDRYELSRFDEL